MERDGWDEVMEKGGKKESEQKMKGKYRENRKREGKKERERDKDGGAGYEVLTLKREAYSFPLILTD